MDINKTNIKKQEPSAIRLTHFQIQIPLSDKVSKEPPKATNYTFYHTDEEGNDQVYTQLQSDEQFKKWAETDHSWKQAQSVMFKRLLSNPSIRDTLIKINIQSALEKGDNDTAVKLWTALSESAKAEIIANLHDTL